MNIVFIGIFAILCVFLVISIYAIAKIRRIYSTIEQFLTSPDEKTPSPLAQVTQVASDMLARSIIAQAKATFMGKQSGSERAETAITGDIAEGLLTAKAPMLGALLNSFPALKKTLRRNPQLIDLAMSKLGNIAGGQPASHSPSNGQTNFKLGV